MDNLLYSIRDMRSKNGPPFVAPGFYRDGHFVAIRDTSFLPSLLAPNSQNLELCTLVDEMWMETIWGWNKPMKLDFFEEHP